MKKRICILLGVFCLSAAHAARPPEAEWDCVDLNDTIPCGQSSVSSLLVLPDGRVLGGCGGEAAHLFVFDPGDRSVEVLKSWMPPGFVRDLQTDASNRAWFVVGPASAAVLPDDHAAGAEHLYSVTLSGKRANVQDHGAPIEDEGMRCIVLDPGRDCLYGVARPTPALFRYDIAKEAFERLTDVGKRRNYERSLTWTPPVERVSADPQVLAVDTNGVVYGAFPRGLFSWTIPEGEADEKETKIKPLVNLTVPAASDRIRAGGNVVESLAWGRDGRLFGGTHDGYLFAADLAADRLVNLGKPFRQAHVRDLTAAPDGRIIGICGERIGYPRLFAYSADTGYEEITVSRRKPPTWFNNDTYGAMALAPDGTIYIGGVGRMTALYSCRPAFWAEP